MSIRLCTAALAMTMGLMGCAEKSSPENGGVSSDASRVRDADISVLFVGNSHTSFHDLPKLVNRMIQFHDPMKSVYTQTIGVNFLEDLAHDSRCQNEIQSRSWKFVVLQAQKISMSGKYDYSKQEGIAIARLARAKGATVYFFSEWGMRGIPGDGARQEKIYLEMARAADSKVTAISRAWDLALVARPELPLYESDGNHQSAVGAFLTACVLFGHLTGESPAGLATFDYPAVNEADRRFLAEMAAKAIAEGVPPQP